MLAFLTWGIKRNRANAARKNFEKMIRRLYKANILIIKFVHTRGNVRPVCRRGSTPNEIKKSAVDRPMSCNYTVFQKTVQHYFCHNFVKLPPRTFLAQRWQRGEAYARCTHFPPHLIYVSALPCEM